MYPVLLIFVVLVLVGPVLEVREHVNECEVVTAHGIDGIDNGFGHCIAVGAVFAGSIPVESETIHHVTDGSANVRRKRGAFQ